MVIVEPVTVVLARAGALLVWAWPRLLAWFLLGWGLRLAALRLAAEVGVHSALLGMLILPLAVLARLGSYIAMFLSLRDGLALDRLQPADDAAAKSVPSHAGEAFAAAVLPFFTLYTAVKFLEQDFEQYARWVLARVNVFSPDVRTGDPTDIGSGWLVLFIAATAFLLRFLLKRRAERLPWWTSVATVYLEALWVLLAVPKVWQALVHGLPQWLSRRRANTWLHGLWDAMLAHAGPLATALHWCGATIVALVPVVAMPIGWLTVAAVIYSRSLDDDDPAARARVVGRLRRGERMRKRWVRLHPVVRSRSRELIADLMARVQPLIDAVRMMARVGLAPMSVYVLAYAVVAAAPSWLFWMITRVVGPHPLPWWRVVDEPIDLLCQAVVEPVRIVLVAAAFAFCAHRFARAESAAGPARTVVRR